LNSFNTEDVQSINESISSAQDVETVQKEDDTLVGIYSSPADTHTIINRTKTQKNVEEPKEVTVYITKTGEKYHSNGCQYLRQSKISISLEDAKQSYGPCSRCNPPR
jgi:hypothetical protein